MSNTWQTAARGKRGNEVAIPALPVVAAAVLKGGKKQKLKHSTQRRDWERAPTAVFTSQQTSTRRVAQQQRTNNETASTAATGTPPQHQPSPASLSSSAPPPSSPAPPCSSQPLPRPPDAAPPSAHPAAREADGDTAMQQAVPAAPQSQVARNLIKAQKHRDRLDRQIAALQQQQQQQRSPAAASATAPAASAAAAQSPSPSASPAASPPPDGQSSSAKPTRKQRIVHSQGDTDRHGLATPTSTDFVLTVDTPAGGRCERLHHTKLATKSNNNDRARRDVVELLSDRTALAIPAPHLSKLLSHNAVHTFRDLDALTSNPTAAQHLTPAERNYLAAAAASRWSDDEGDERGYLRTGNLPTASCHKLWTDLLTPATCAMSATKSRSSGGHRLVLRLAFNNEVVCSIVRLYLADYINLFEGHDTSALDPEAIAAWKASTSPSGASKASLTVTPYVPRYETTAVTGWPLGPDGPPSSELFMDFTQPLGNLDALRNLIAARAPHCTRWHVHDRAGASATVQFFHERQYRTELFALDDTTSPRHGIFRPLRLRYKQREPPAMQCCSYCGEPGHSAKTCPLTQAPRSTPATGSSTMDTTSPASPRSGVCRLCYNPAPYHVCQTPPEQRHCKLCGKQGHTSFVCSQYRSHWAPLNKPPASKPVNPRPLYIAASQRGVPWSSVVTGPPPAPQPAPTPALPLHSLLHFPSLPSGHAPPSPTPSTASPPASPASSPPPSPTSPPAAVDQQALLANVIAAVLAQLTPHLISLADTMAKLTARTDALYAELQEERATRQKQHPFPLPQPPAHWSAAPPAPIDVHMADTQPAAQLDPQRSTASASPTAPAAPQTQHHGYQIQFVNQGSSIINNGPAPTFPSSALPTVLASSLPSPALQPAGLTSAQQPAPPPNYHQ
jgi:hypothetical protein